MTYSEMLEKKVIYLTEQIKKQQQKIAYLEASLHDVKKIFKYAIEILNLNKT